MEIKYGKNKSVLEGGIEQAMKMGIFKENKALNFLWIYLLLDCALKWIAMYTGIRNGVISSFVLLTFIAFVSTLKGIKTILGRTSIYIIFYIIYSFLMAIVALNRGYNIGLLLSELSNTIIPMFVFFIGKKMTEKQATKFELIFALIVLLILVSGIAYNLTLCDPYYLAFAAENHAGFAISWFSKMPKLNSFYGSVACGTFGCFLICFAFERYIKTKKKDFWIIYIMGILTSCLSLQRSAMVMAIFMSAILFLYCVYKKQMNIRVLFIIFIIIVIGTILLKYLYPTAFDAFFTRIGQVSSVFKERSGGWKNAFSNGFFSTLVGYGFGTGGQRAIGISAKTVNDGNYFKIIYDLGIWGLFMFLAIIISAWRASYKIHSYPYKIAAIGFMIQMLGSNLLTFFSTALIFWYVIGRMVSQNRGV